MFSINPLKTYPAVMDGVRIVLENTVKRTMDHFSVALKPVDGFC